MANTPKEISEYMRGIGKKGGATTMERFGREHFSNIAKSKKGSSWKWSPEKKGKRKPKDAISLQKSVVDSIIPPGPEMKQ
jgi:hypothetical protein